MSDVTQGNNSLLPNDPAARATDGTIKDQQATQPQGIPDQKTPDTKSEPAAKPDGTKAEPAAKDGDKPKAPEGAPEKYGDFKAPEGFEIDKPALEAALPIFKELNLSQDQAQKLVDFYSNISKEAADKPYQLYEQMRDGWRTDAIKDATLGNGKDGLKPEVKTAIGRAIDSLPADVATNFKAAMDLTGAGDNPAFLHAFYNLAQRLGEGSLVRGGGPAPTGQAKPGSGPASAAQALYPNLPSSNKA